MAVMTVIQVGKIMMGKSCQKIIFRRHDLGGRSSSKSRPHVKHCLVGQKHHLGLRLRSRELGTAEVNIEKIPMARAPSITTEASEAVGFEGLEGRDGWRAAPGA